MNNKPVLHTFVPKQAEAVAADAKQAVKERRIDTGQARKATDTTGERYNRAPRRA